ncbi:Ankyrin repeat-containing domain [Phytophthora cactorum]|nr:Ankyrin repeat-containing domain [Phytophthora cactorum]
MSSVLITTSNIGLLQSGIRSPFETYIFQVNRAFLATCLEDARFSSTLRTRGAEPGTSPGAGRLRHAAAALGLHGAVGEPQRHFNARAGVPDACQLENLSGMLPLHVAIKAKAPGLLVSALLDVNPQAALAKDGSGHYPVDLAISNSLPSFTIDLIRKAGARALQSGSKMRATSIDDLTSVSSSDHNQSEDDEDIPIIMKTQSMMTSSWSLGRNLSTASFTIDPVDSNTISLQLKELLSQLHQLSRPPRHGRIDIGAMEPERPVWHPAGAAVKEMGARIKGFSSRSNVLGVESLAVGDVLVNINGASVANTAFASIMRFLKHSKGTCKLRFRSAVDATTASKCSTGSNPAVEQDNAMYSKVAEMLETTLKKVSAVEETVRLSSAMSLCT